MPREKTDLAIKALSLFNALAGKWAGTAQTWFEPGVLADESPVQGVFRFVPESRTLLWEYEAILQGNPYHGLLVCSFNLFKQRYETVWVDSFHSSANLLISTGEEAGHGFSVMGSYPTGDTTPDWGWRTEIRLELDDKLMITMYNIPPGGDEAKGIEFALQRIK